MNKKITFVLVLALAAFLVMGSASAGFFDFLGGGDDTVKIGYLPSDHDAALLCARRSADASVGFLYEPEYRILLFFM